MIQKYKFYLLILVISNKGHQSMFPNFFQKIVKHQFYNPFINEI